MLQVTEQLCLTCNAVTQATGAGGLGLAAVHVCRALGGGPLGTAGSPAKRWHLRSAGIRCVHSSRSTAFTEALLGAGGGSKPHVALNSLTSPGEQQAPHHERMQIEPV